MKRMIRFLLFGCLLWFGGYVRAEPAACPSPSFLFASARGIQSIAYDENQRSIVYDDVPNIAFGYDRIAVLLTIENQRTSIGTRVFSVDLAKFLAAKGALRVGPAGLRLPPTRAEGADPFKLADQIKKYGSSTEGMPPIQVTRGANGEMMINDGVTRATRGAMTPGTTVPVEVIEQNPALNLQNLPRVGERTPGRP